MTLEELLNKCIQRGWKPFGIEYPIHIHYYEFNDVSLYKIETTIWWGETLGRRICHTLRDISSVESWLWQFCVDNEIIKIKDRDRRYYNEDNHLDKVCFDDGYYYRIIESALTDEDKLEEFLLNSIKIDE